jgi:hypothetical protein
MNIAPNVSGLADVPAVTFRGQARYPNDDEITNVEKPLFSRYSGKPVLAAFGS